MKITGWTDYFDERYEERAGDADVNWLIAAELRKRGYKFTGDYHQHGDFGVPIIDNKYKYTCSQRYWGGIMVMAYPEEIDNSDGYGYTTWAWIAPGEQIVPKNEDYEED